MNIGKASPATDIPPANTIREITVCEFQEAVRKFTDRFLRGAVSFRTECDSEDAIEISPELTAHMFRLLVFAAQRRAILSVEAFIDGGIYTWRVSLGKRQPSRTVMCKIKAAAKEAGFVCHDLDAESILLTARLKQRQVLSIYAASGKEVFQALTKIFFRINPFLTFDF